MKRKGFTMLEILIVIIIIAILATFAIPQYLKASKKAIASEAVTTIGAIRGGLARYYQEFNAMPLANCSNLDIDNPNSTTANFTYGFTGNMTDGYEVTASPIDTKRSKGITVTYTSSDNIMDIAF